MVDIQIQPVKKDFFFISAENCIVVLTSKMRCAKIKPIIPIKPIE